MISPDRDKIRNATQKKKEGEKKEKKGETIEHPFH